MLYFLHNTKQLTEKMTMPPSILSLFYRTSLPAPFFP